MITPMATVVAFHLIGILLVEAMTLLVLTQKGRTNSPSRHVRV